MNCPPPVNIDIKLKMGVWGAVRGRDFGLGARSAVVNLSLGRGLRSSSRAWGAVRGRQVGPGRGARSWIRAKSAVSRSSIILGKPGALQMPQMNLL